MSEDQVETKRGLTLAGVLYDQLSIRKNELYETSKALRQTQDSLQMAKYELGRNYERADQYLQRSRSNLLTGLVSGIMVSLSIVILVGAAYPTWMRWYH